MLKRKKEEKKKDIVVCRWVSDFGVTYCVVVVTLGLAFGRLSCAEVTFYCCSCFYEFDLLFFLLFLQSYRRFFFPVCRVTPAIAWVQLDWNCRLIMNLRRWLSYSLTLWSYISLPHVCQKHKQRICVHIHTSFTLIYNNTRTVWAREL